MNFQKIKNSFITKLFLSLALLYVILLLVSILFQSLLFKSFITNRIINQTVTEINELFDDVTLINVSEEIVDFSQETQTTSLLVSSNELIENFSSLSLNVINVDVDGINYAVYVPNLEDGVYEIDDSVIANVLYHEPSDGYIPVNLIVDNVIILNSPDNRINHIYEEFIRGVEPFSNENITGTITSISLAVPSSGNVSINPIISNEILNILSKNYEEITQFSNDGYYYVTSSQSSGVSNLVFYADTKIANQEFILISVYPLSHIDDIVHTVRTFNIMIFLFLFILLFISAFVYSKRFSQPLTYINNTTKKLSNLDFSDDLIHINSTDEFGQLAANINTLSVNLKTTIDKLNEQNKQLSQTLNTENLNEEKRREFISGMSHELKTPLSIIQAAAEGLEKGVFKTEDARSKQRSVIQSEVIKVNKMLNDMITVYKLDNPLYMENWDMVNLKDIVSNVNDNLVLLQKNKSLVVNLYLDDVSIYGEKDKLELIISNLFNNAIKYTPKFEKIEVYLRNLDKYVEFEIINYGVNISEEQANRLFEAFYRVDTSRTRDDGSVGLGLYIVKQLLEQFDSMCIVKQLSNGVSFSFKLLKTNKKEG